MIYLDSCALVKIIVPEVESSALVTFLERHSRNRQVSSALVRTEVRRVLLRKVAQQHRFEHAGRLLNELLLVGLEDSLLDAAGAIPGRSLRSLDAIHLATAELLQPNVDMFLTYDHKLAAAAEERGFRVVAPQ